MKDILEVVFMFSLKNTCMEGCSVYWYKKANILEVNVKVGVFCRHPEMLSDGCCSICDSHDDGTCVIKVVEIIEHWRLLLSCIGISQY